VYTAEYSTPELRV